MKILFLSIMASIGYFLYSIPYGEYVIQPKPVFTMERLSLSRIPALEHLPSFSDDEVACLQRNIFFEAATEDSIGQIAVGLVTLNRVDSDKFPNTICGVVQQALTNTHGVPIRHQCQFSWYCDGKSDSPNLKNEYVKRVWDEIGELAYHIANDNHGYDTVGKSLFYHVNGITVSWSDAFDEHAIVGSHVFYTMN